MVKINKKPIKFLLSAWLINLAAIYIASLLYPEDIVLGNSLLPGGIALLIVSAVLTLIATQVPLIMKTLRLKLTNQWLLGIVYAITNIIILWLVARAAYYTGFGISSLLIALILGLVLAILQYGVNLAIVKKRG